ACGAFFAWCEDRGLALDAIRLIDAIPTETVRDLRDRALIGTPRLLIRAHRRGAQDEGRGSATERRRLGNQAARERRKTSRHAIPPAAGGGAPPYIDAAAITEDRKGVLFRTSPGHNAMALTEQPMD